MGRARRHLAPHARPARVDAGATDLSRLVPDGGIYDAVFDFGIVHHVPTGRAALAEAARLLKPGGVFYFGGSHQARPGPPSYRVLFDHPTDDRFTDAYFVAELDRHGLAVRDHRTLVFGDFVVGAAPPQAALPPLSEVGGWGHEEC